MESVICSGVLFIKKESGVYKYLLIQNSRTGLLEVPKGIKSDNENKFSCALREAVEEVSISVDIFVDEVYAPYSICYKDSISMKNKVVDIFPIIINEVKEVHLSIEHKVYRWASNEYVKKLEKEGRLLKCYSRIITEVNDSISNDNVLLKNFVIRCLSRVIEEKMKNYKYSWYLVGSLSADEYSVYKGKILSDIDIVAVVDKCPSSYDMKKISDIFENAQRISEKFYDYSVGLFYIEKNGVIDVATPFGEYMQKNNTLLSMGAGDFVYASIKKNETSYDLFRLFWYALLRSMFLSDISKSYLYMKSNILYYYFKNTKKISFYSYENIKKAVIRDLYKGSKFFLEEEVVLILKAIDVKLNNSKMLLSIDWEKCLLCFMEKELKCFSGEKKNVLREIYKIKQGLYEKSADMVNMLKFYLSDECVYLYDYACKNKDSNILWLILILLRVEIWPEQVQFSKNKYKAYVRKLLKNMQNSNSCMTKDVIKMLNYYQL